MRDSKGRFVKGTYKYNESIHEEAVKLYQSGLGIQRIRNVLGIKGHDTIQLWLARNGVQIRKWKRYDPSIEFKPIYDEDLGYVLGVIFGDGSAYITKSTYRPKYAKKYPMWMITLNVTDRDFADAFADSLARVLRRKKPIPIQLTTFNKKRKFKQIPKRQWRVQAYGKQFVLWIKSLNFSILQKLLRENKNMARGFLRGFFDSEGSVIHRHYTTKYGNPQFDCSVNVYNTEKHLLKICRIICENLFKIRTQKIYKRFQKTNFAPEGYSCHVLKIGDRIEIQKYMEQIGFSIARKRQKWLDFCQGEVFNG